jgi:hypothetical protein
MRYLIRIVVVAAIATLAACSTTASPVPSTPVASPSAAGGPSVFPVIISSEQYVGSNRFIFSFVDLENRPAATPERTVEITAYPTASGPTAAVTSESTFLWTIPDTKGAYRSTIPFNEAGEWTLEFTTSAPGGVTEIIRLSLDVRADASAIVVGEAAPAVTTPTLDDVGGDLAKLSTDADPEPRFYELSVDAALETGEPFVLVFATPKFCTSSACGPMLDTVKAVAADFPAVRVVNVEPYELTVTDGELQPVVQSNGFPKVVPSVVAYGIPSEPWLYAIDADGIVSASFESVVTEDELRAAFEGLAQATG